MNRQQLLKKRIPDVPGVYFFMGKRKEILYIGRATNLGSRIRSYFAYDIADKRSVAIANMVTEARNVEWTVTDSVLEAMLLEVNLIRTHKPKFNTLSKDDKSFNHCVVTNEAYPRVLVVRGKDLERRFKKGELKKVYGPFPHGLLFKEALKLIKKIFQYYDTDKPLHAKRSKMEQGIIDFNRQIGLFPEHENKAAYRRAIRHIELLFEGKKNRIIRELKRDMMKHARHQEFEHADVIKRRIAALEHIQDVALIKDEARMYRDDRRARIEAYDVSHLSGTGMVGAMAVVEGGHAVPSAYRTFNIRSVRSSNDTAALSEMFERRLTHGEWPLPEIVVVDGGTAQKNVIEHILRRRNIALGVVGVVKDERHKPERIIGQRDLVHRFEKDILLANAESHRFALAKQRRKRRQ